VNCAYFTRERISTNQYKAEATLHQREMAIMQRALRGVESKNDGIEEVELGNITKRKTRRLGHKLELMGLSRAM
jgi:hypothetical protein